MTPKRSSVKPPRQGARKDVVRDLTVADSLLEDVDTAEGERATPAAGRSDRISSVLTSAVKRRQDRFLETLRGVALTLGGELDLLARIRLILEAAVQEFEAERGILFLGRSLEAPLVPVVAVDMQGEELEALERVSRTILREAQTRQFFMTPDAVADPRLKSVRSVWLKKVRSVMCARLVVRDELVGLLYLDHLGSPSLRWPRSPCRTPASTVSCAWPIRGSSTAWRPRIVSSTCPFEARS